LDTNFGQLKGHQHVSESSDAQRFDLPSTHAWQDAWELQISDTGTVP
jgi:hypothetical protein